MSSDVRIYFTVHGSRQGQFSDGGAPPNPAQLGSSIKLRGQSSAPQQVQGQSQALSALKFSYGVTSPTNLSTGMASGMRQHKPIMITKEPSAASPLFFSALITNEALTIMIQFVRQNAQGQNVVQQGIALTNAKIINFLQYVGDDGRWLEDVEFTFQNIEINTPGQKVAEDDWRATH